MERINYSKKEASSLLGISIRSLSYLIANDRIDSVKHGRRRFINRDELLRFARIDQPRFDIPA